MIDVNTPVENPQLVESIHKMYQNNNTDTQNEVLKQILNAHFLAPISMNSQPKGQNQNGIITLEENTKLSFFTIVNTNKQYYLPAFTDWDELRKWKNEENQQTLIVKIQDYISLVSNDKNISGCTINPFGENLIITSYMLEVINKCSNPFSTGGINQYEMEKDTRILLGEPENYPSDMIKAISDYLKTQDNVNAAYLQLMTTKDVASYLIILDFIGDEKILFNEIGKRAMPYLNGIYLDITRFNSNFQDVREKVKPFYKR